MEKSFAVITGASSGIGLELAKQFGENGFDMLIASDSDRIFEAQKELEELGYSADAMKVNLASHAGVENLYREIQRAQRKVDAVVINAGIGLGGAFDKTSLNKEIKLINLNVISAIHLTKKILPDMKQRGEGKILYTSSIVSEMPSPYQAVYGASKAFITSFAEALRSELKETNITITILKPGATNTRFFHRAHMDDTELGANLKNKNDPSEVAKQGFEALMEGRETVFSESLMTKLQGYAQKILPQKAKANLQKKFTEPGSAHH